MMIPDTIVSYADLDGVEMRDCIVMENCCVSVIDEPTGGFNILLSADECDLIDDFWVDGETCTVSLSGTISAITDSILSDHWGDPEEWATAFEREAQRLRAGLEQGMAR